MFEHSLIDLDAQKKSRRRWLALPVAIVLHLVALASLTFANYWNVSKVEEPPLNLIFVQGEPPPPVAKGTSEVKKPVVKPATAPMPQPETKTIQPKDVPNDLPPSTSTVIQNVVEQRPGLPEGVEKGDPKGSIFGVPDSHGTDPIPGPPVTATPESNEPIHVGGAVKAPEILSRVEPRYTDIARHSGTEGVVVLQAVIDEDGRVTNLSVIKGLPMGLEQAAVDAVRQWRFKAATLQGRPVKVYYNLTVRFSIQR
jgi:protein TonB